MVSLISGKSDTKFKAAVQTSPALVDAEEAKSVKIPTLLLLSKDEGGDDWKEYEGNLSVTKKAERFEGPHGFMSARADLKDKTMTTEYEQGYKLAAEFFNEHL